MAIQMRRGLKKDFDPSKMLPGEWAVSIDSVTSNQIVWMCFAAGVCKRMGTYEDFYAQIAEATEDIRDSYVSDFDEIKATVQTLADAVSSDKNEILIIKSDIVNTYLPQIQALIERAETATSKAETSANNSSTSATLSQSYAVGETGTREGENADNAKYYYEQAKHISQGGNGLVPMGTIAFEDIPITDIVTNAMYNISNDFISDERFVDGGGVLYGKGSNIFYTVDGLWDVLAASDVKGVKGASEDTYRQGNVNITAENVGAVAIGGDTADNIVEFTSSDLSEPTEWTDVAVLASGEKHSTILNKISKIFKNVRYMYKMLGTTDISSISDGTISGVLAFLKNEIEDVNSNLWQPISSVPISGYEVLEDSYVKRDMFHRVDLFLSIKATILTDTWHTIAMLPAEYCPKGYIYASCKINSSGEWLDVDCYIYNTNEIKIFTSLPNGTYTIRVYGTYSVDV